MRWKKGLYKYWVARVQPGTQEERLKLEICT